MVELFLILFGLDLRNESKGQLLFKERCTMISYRKGCKQILGLILCGLQSRTQARLKLQRN
jgi:hypothetical protein